MSDVALSVSPPSQSLASSARRHSPLSIRRQLGDWRSTWLARGDQIAYLQLAHAIEADIASGEFAVGDLLPPERTLADALEVSRTTIVAALGWLRERQWVESRQGSGTRIARAPLTSRAGKNIVQPYALRLHESRGALRTDAADSGVIDLSLAQYQPPAQWVSLSDEARLRILRTPSYQPRGLLELRERIADRYTRQGLPTTPDQVLITNGSQQAISLIVARFLPVRQTVVTQTPNYFGALEVFRAQRARVEGIPVSSRDSGATQIAKRLKQGDVRLAYVCPSFHNPTGNVMTMSERELLLRAAASADTPLVIDECMSETAFAAVPAPMAAVGRGRFDQAPIFTVSSISKSVWGALRVGWIRASAELINVLSNDRTVHDLGSSVVIGAIACDVFAGLDSFLAQRREQHKSQCAALCVALCKHLPTWRFAPPEGSPYLWVDTGLRDAAPLIRALQQAGVHVGDGATMTVETKPNGYLRLAFVSPVAVYDDAARRMAVVFQAIDGKTLK